VQQCSTTHPKSLLQNLQASLRNYAVELRQLAYTLPNGVGEHDFLQLSGRMRATADQEERQRSVADG
jgi:hypothetical protein